MKQYSSKELISQYNNNTIEYDDFVNKGEVKIDLMVFDNIDDVDDIEVVEYKSSYQLNVFSNNKWYNFERNKNEFSQGLEM